MLLSILSSVAAAQDLTPVEVGLDLVPTVGTSSSMMGTDLRSISLSLLGGYAGAVDGVELSMGVNIDRYHLSGIQLAGFANLVGTDVDGVQGAAALNMVGGSVDGIQMSGGVNLVGGMMDGVQMASGLNVVSGVVDGVQLSGGANLAGDVSGAQIAPVNLAGNVDGVQIGVVNVARTSDFSLGVVNIVLEGRTHLDVTVDELGLGTVAFKHGGAGFHYIYSLGFRPGLNGAWMPAMGLGGHREWRRLFIDTEVVTGQLFEHWAPLGLNLRTTGRLVGGLSLTDRLSVIAGPSYNVLVTDACGAKYRGLGVSTLSTGPVAVLGWPGFMIGIELL
ncbi:MAG: hypothetical protein ACI8RZ_002556 [Myxococcota bacterium]|jgi:hypothetical protein